MGDHDELHNSSGVKMCIEDVVREDQRGLESECIARIVSKRRFNILPVHPAPNATYEMRYSGTAGPETAALRVRFP